MTNTRDKLNEAKFFLEEMERVSSESDQFRYMLTAFLAASRSITQIMQKEFSKKPGFSHWYTQKQKEIGNNSILKYLHKQRTLTYHVRPVLQYPIGGTELITEQKRTNIILSGTGSNLAIPSTNFPMIRPFSSVKYYFSDFANKEKDVITICQEAINVIEGIVNECTNNFGDDASTSFEFA